MRNVERLTTMAAHGMEEKCNVLSQKGEMGDLVTSLLVRFFLSWSSDLPMRDSLPLANFALRRRCSGVCAYSHVLVLMPTPIISIALRLVASGSHVGELPYHDDFCVLVFEERRGKEKD
jgi:hypothetical protein